MSLSAGQLVPGSSAKPPRSPHIPSGPHVESPHCHFIQHQQDPIAAVICCMYIIFGLVYTLFGKLLLLILFQSNQSCYIVKSQYNGLRLQPMKNLLN